ncbi:protein phosphatase 2C domain-containing protein [Nitrospirillum iridis]|uniref:PPM-type phosphatase domain-containing protein n=1 Tax=Nitrospirillum iridis TaxID=765888 RepID=A0A7X0B4S6_9PROT|nr:protein phosphatase 2C domain-containing protein [Nitrospirillum iridis]MBB6255407.1 hypothetical protein [Nitrospirillum iridis]
MFEIYCCQHGMIAIDRQVASQVLESLQPLGGRVTQTNGYLLPGCRSEDVILNQPALPITLDFNELMELIGAGDGWPVAATCYGPPQDKSRNEDSALSAVIPGAGATRYAFAAVADGVSTRTFWSERASRLACLAAFKVIRSMILDSTFDAPDFAPSLRKKLATTVLEALKMDQSIIREKKATPPDWSPELYQRHINRDEFWYNSTLLVSCLGHERGVAFWVGDGGVKIVKIGPDGTNLIARDTHLKSTDDVEIGSYVSLAKNIVFAGGPINYSDSSAVHVYLATDGVDRTLQRARDLDYENISMQDCEKACKALEEIWLLPGAEVDNYSVARASWPIGTSIPIANNLATALAPTIGNDILPPATRDGLILATPETALAPTAGAAVSSVPHMDQDDDCHAVDADQAEKAKLGSSGTTRERHSSEPPMSSTSAPRQVPDHPLTGARDNQFSASAQPSHLQKQDPSADVSEKARMDDIIPIINLVKRTEVRYGHLAPHDINLKVNKSAYRLIILSSFFTRKIMNIKLLNKMSNTQIGKFLDIEPLEFKFVAIKSSYISTRDGFLKKLFSEILSNNSLRELSKEKEHEKNWQALLLYIQSQSRP